MYAKVSVLLILLAVNLHAQSPKQESAVLGAGCFWCVEAIFERLEGVHSVASGYSGGQTKNPTYKQVVRGNTGHAEVVKVNFDSEKISFEEILEVFWKTHDPTTLNRQGADVGTQYRSAIFYTSEAQKATAETSKRKFSSYFEDPIVTEITAFKKFYKAENYHQDYFELNGNQPYCRAVIKPKIKKFEQQFKEKIKKK